MVIEREKKVVEEKAVVAVDGAVEADRGIVIVDRNTATARKNVADLVLDHTLVQSLVLALVHSSELKKTKLKSVLRN